MGTMAFESLKTVFPNAEITVNRASAIRFFPRERGKGIYYHRAEHAA